MMKNESNLDRVIRVILAVVFFGVGYYFFGTVGMYIFYVLSLVMFVTAITGFCGLYKLFGIKTKK